MSTIQSIKLFVSGFSSKWKDDDLKKFIRSKVKDKIHVKIRINRHQNIQKELNQGIVTTDTVEIGRNLIDSINDNNDLKITAKFSDGELENLGLFNMQSINRDYLLTIESLNNPASEEFLKLLETKVLSKIPKCNYNKISNNIFELKFDNIDQIIYAYQQFASDNNYSIKITKEKIILPQSSPTTSNNMDIKWIIYQSSEDKPQYYNILTQEVQWNKPENETILTLDEAKNMLIKNNISSTSNNISEITNNQSTLSISDASNDPQYSSLAQQYINQGIINLTAAKIPNNRFGPTGCNLFIFHLPNEWSEIELCELFKKQGNIISSRIVLVSSTQRSKGQGFISYDNPNSAQAAISELNGFMANGKRLNVSLKKENNDPNVMNAFRNPYLLQQSNMMLNPTIQPNMMMSTTGQTSMLGNNIPPNMMIGNNINYMQGSMMGGMLGDNK